MTDILTSIAADAMWDLDDGYVFCEERGVSSICSYWALLLLVVVMPLHVTDDRPQSHIVTLPPEATATSDHSCGASMSRLLTPCGRRLWTAGH